MTLSRFEQSFQLFLGIFSCYENSILRFRFIVVYFWSFYVCSMYVVWMCRVRQFPFPCTTTTTTTKKCNLRNFSLSFMIFHPPHPFVRMHLTLPPPPPLPPVTISNDVYINIIHSIICDYLYVYFVVNCWQNGEQNKLLLLCVNQIWIIEFSIKTTGNEVRRW